MILITIFVKLRVVARRSQKQAGKPQAISQWPCCAVALRRKAWSEQGMSATWAWRGKCESDTVALCKSNGEDTFQTLSGTAWHGHGMLRVNQPLRVCNVLKERSAFVFEQSRQFFKVSGSCNFSTKHNMSEDQNLPHPAFCENLVY